MATKDWKRIGKDEWQSIREFLKIDRIARNSYYSTSWFKKDDIYMVVITQATWPMSVHRKGFKTKSQALAFAKAYMRSH